jgi:hypothetical protein
MRRASLARIQLHRTGPALAAAYCILGCEWADATTDRNWEPLLRTDSIMQSKTIGCQGRVQCTVDGVKCEYSRDMRGDGAKCGRLLRLSTSKGKSQGGLVRQRLRGLDGGSHWLVSFSSTQPERRPAATES